MKTKTLEIKWTVSRARDTHGYNICTLYVDGRKAAACNGGGYDMKGTVLGNWLASAFADRLLKLKPEDMPEQSHWQRVENPRRICRDTNCIIDRVKEATIYTQELTCPKCGKATEIDHNEGEIINEGRYFYGLTYHDPNFDPGKAVVGKDCLDRTLGEGSKGQTVEEAEEANVSFGLERLQAFYSASSRIPTERHTIPLIDGACGWSEVEKIAKAIGITFEYIKTRSKNLDIWTAHIEPFSYKVQYTPETCPGRPCGTGCDHVGEVTMTEPSNL
jgi:hypothetical protein